MENILLLTVWVYLLNIEFSKKMRDTVKWQVLTLESIHISRAKNFTVKFNI